MGKSIKKGKVDEFASNKYNANRKGLATVPLDSSPWGQELARHEEEKAAMQKLASPRLEENDEVLERLKGGT
jgi:hypothetical protein